jgi:hypothetical protein
MHASLLQQVLQRACWVSPHAWPQSFAVQVLRKLFTCAMQGSCFLRRNHGLLRAIHCTQIVHFTAMHRKHIAAVFCSQFSMAMCSIRVLPTRSSLRCRL